LRSPRGLQKRLDRAPGRTAVTGGKDSLCSLVFLFSKTALEESFITAEGFSRGLDREPRKGVSLKEHVVDSMHI
jgi:hypothetical protein